MTGEQLVGRLISDLDKSLSLRNAVVNDKKQIENLNQTSAINLSNFNSALNFHLLDGHLDVLSQFINFDESLIDHKKGTKGDLKKILIDIQKHKEQIVTVFEKIISQRQFDNDLIEELDSIHNASN